VKKIKSHTFRGKRYKIKWKYIPKKEEAIGFCTSPDVKDKHIIIDPKNANLELLRAAIDEGIHACLWDLDNDAVSEMSESISRFIWRLGFRDVTENRKL
jgi:hypothetical protein